MGFDENKEVGEKSGAEKDIDENEETEKLGRQMSENSLYTTDHEEEDYQGKLELGPQFTIKEQLEKDKVSFFLFGLEYVRISFSFIRILTGMFVTLGMQDDESLRKWKEQLLGSVDLDEIGGTLYIFYFIEFILEISS